MKTFHLISYPTASNEKPEPIPGLFEQACKTLDVKYVFHDSEHSPFEGSFGVDDLVYRSATTSRAHTLAQYLMTPACTHLYDDWRQVSAARGASFFVHRQLNLPVISTYPALPRNEEEIETCLSVVGAFPIIIKVRGGTHGVGVIRVDSRESFRTVRDYLIANSGKAFVRKYVPHEFYVRAIVLGDDVVAAHATYTVPGEFRTNTDEIEEQQQRKQHNLSDDEKRVVVQAVRSLGLHFGGVDLLVDAEGKLHIAEVNFPCQFNVTQEVTGIDIAKQMVVYLIQRSEQNK